MKPSVRRDMKQHWRLNLGAQMSPELWRECGVAACAHAQGALSPTHPRARTQHSGAPLPRPVSARPTQSWPSVAEALRLLQTVSRSRRWRVPGRLARLAVPTEPERCRAGHGRSSVPGARLVPAGNDRVRGRAQPGDTGRPWLGPQQSWPGPARRLSPRPAALSRSAKPLRSFFSSYLKSLPDVRKKSLALPAKPHEDENSEVVAWREFDRQVSLLDARRPGVMRGAGTVGTDAGGRGSAAGLAPGEPAGEPAAGPEQRGGSLWGRSEKGGLRKEATFT